MYKLSIIIPVYNRPQLLEETLESTKELKSNIEIIVIDDGSKKNNASVQKKLANKYNAKYFYQENKGLSKARNAGIRKAKGKFLFFLDSDDLLTLEIVEFFNTNKEWELYDVSRFWSRDFDSKNPNHKKITKTKSHSKFLKKRDMQYSGQCSSFLIRKSFLINKQLWWEGRLYEDNMWYVKLLENHSYKKMRVFKIYSIYYRVELDKYKLTAKNKITYSEISSYLDKESYENNFNYLYLSFWLLGGIVSKKLLKNKDLYIDCKLVDEMIIFFEYVLKNKDLILKKSKYKKWNKSIFKIIYEFLTIFNRGALSG